MDPELNSRLTVLEQKVDATYRVAHSARTMFLWTIILTVAFAVIPLIGIAIVLPTLLKSYNIDSILSQ